jgi:hypothetical protein
MSDEQKTVRVRIQNDGTPFSTVVTDCETGKVLDGVNKVQWVADAHEMDRLPQAEIIVIVPVVDIIADAEIRKVCPCCGRDVEESEQQEMKP